MFNVAIIRPRHKINTVDNSILLCLLNMSEFVSSGTTEWTTALEIIRTKCQACQKPCIQIRRQTGSLTASRLMSGNSCARAHLEVKHQTRFHFLKMQWFSQSASPCTGANTIYLGWIRQTGEEKSNLQMSLVDNENSDVAVSCSPQPDASLSLIATRTQRCDRQMCDSHPRYSDLIKGIIDN